MFVVTSRHAGITWPDFLVRDEGTIMLLTPQNDAAHDWLRDNVSDTTTHWGGSIVVEPRYLMPILEGARAEGFTIGQEAK